MFNVAIPRESLTYVAGSNQLFLGQGTDRRADNVRGGMQIANNGIVDRWARVHVSDRWV